MLIWQLRVNNCLGVEMWIKSKLRTYFFSKQSGLRTPREDVYEVHS